MRVLLITSKPFLPCIDGGNFASKQLYEQLVSEGASVNYLTLYSEKHPIQPELFEKENIQLGFSFPVKLKFNFFKAIISFIKGQSYNLIRFHNADLTQYLKDLSFRYDLILFDSLYATYPLLDPNVILKCPVWLRSHNVEHQLWVDKATQQLNPIKRLYFKSLGANIHRYTKSITSKIDKVLTISSEDFKYYNTLNIANVVLFPIHTKLCPVQHEPEAKFFHLGAMNWKPNVESALNFINNFAPSVKKKLPNAQFSIAGSFMDNFKFQIPGYINNLGFVSNSKEFIQSAGILVALVESGSGVRIKILEALALGSIVLTTSKGAEGIDVDYFPSLIVSDNLEELIAVGIQYATSKEARTTLNMAIAQKQTIETQKPGILQFNG